MKQLLILCVALLLALAACGQAPVEPVTTTSAATTEAQAQPADTSFETFYSTFTAAVHSKDMQFIDGILDDGTMSSFGGEPGKEYFYEYWDIRQEHYQKDLWDELGAIIALGGEYYEAGEYHPSFGECFVAPWTFMAINDTGLDAFEHLAVLGEGVPVYEKEDVESKVTGTLDYGYVAYHSELRDIGPEEFVSITALSGTAGYVQWKFLRSPIDYRLCLERKDSGWKLLWLIAGD